METVKVMQVFEKIYKGNECNSFQYTPHSTSNHTVQ